MKLGLKGMAGLLIVGLLGAVLAGPQVVRVPFPQGDRLDGGDLVGVDAGGSYAWVIPTATGVVLVDSGWDDSGAAIESELAGRTVHAVLITHGHFDHTAGLPLYPDATVYTAPGEGPLLRGEVSPGGMGARMASTMMGGPAYTPPRLVEFSDGQSLEIDGESIRAFHVPGHTGGSAAYIWRDVLFTGDSIVGRGDHVSEMPSLTYDDVAAVPGSLEKVLDVPFERMADGHAGLHLDARAQVEAFVGR
jgi:hydroxyacylglutathione hydrolase